MILHVTKEQYGIRLVFLIEHGADIRTLNDVKKWKNPRLKTSKLAVSGERLYKILSTLEKTYDTKFYFCTKEQTPRGIIKLLYGHYGSDVHAGDTITEAEATELLERDLKVFENAVNNAVKVEITQSQFDALVSLSYNIGTGAFADSDTVKALNEGKVGHAAVDIPSWRRGMGYQILPGLEKRRQTELEFFAIGEDFTLTDCMNVRTGAGTNYPVKTVSQLTANGRENAVNRSASAQAVFREGTEITALEVKAVYSPQRVEVWFRCPSGWICARMGEEVNVK